MSNITKFIIPVFSAIGALLTVITILDFDEEICTKCWPVNYTIYFTYFLFVVALAIALMGAVTGALAKPSSIKGSAFGIVGMLVIVGISYALANDEVLTTYPQGTTAAAIKWSGAGLYTLYILVVLTVISVIYSGLARFIKR